MAWAARQVGPISSISNNIINSSNTNNTSSSNINSSSSNSITSITKFKGPWRRERSSSSRRSSRREVTVA